MNISAIITCHRERLYCGPSLRSFSQAIDYATNSGLIIEPIIVLDRVDELTSEIVDRCDYLPKARLLKTDLGEPGLARMHGVAASSGEFITFLDADDLWSFNWITAAAEFVRSQGKDTIAHSEANVVFGINRLLWLHADSKASQFRYEYLRISNYWDSMCFAARDIFDACPMSANDLKAGYGHEDWHWNCLTYSAGYHHRPVPGTVHMKRARPGSQMANCVDNDVVARPTPLTVHSWPQLL